MARTRKPRVLVNCVANAHTSPRKKYYAAFVGGSYGQEISLHRTKRAAMEEVARTFDIPLTTDEDPPQVRDDDELSEAFDEHCSSRADDWHVNEVPEP